MKKVLLCFLAILVMVLIITPSSYARDGNQTGESKLTFLQTETVSSDEFGVNYIRYGIYNPGWHLSRLNVMDTTKTDYNNKNNCVGCHIKMTLPEPKQRSPSFKG